MMQAKMQAMILHKQGELPQLEEVPIPFPKEDQILIRVHCCGLCRTDLHIIDGDLPSPKLPLILGHQIVGTVVECGKKVNNLKVGEKVGVPWLGESCGLCSYCLMGKENLCDHPIFTGYTRDGGFAQYCIASAQFVFPLSPFLSDEHLASLLCAGMIGYRALRLTEGGKKIAFFGFGTSAHLLIQVVKHQQGEVYAFTRKGDTKGQEFALKLGATYASDNETLPLEKLDSAIVFAPVGSLMIQGLKVVKKGGIVVSAGIHMSQIPAFSYDLLWEERVLRSVSNLTREDGYEFLKIAKEIPIQTSIKTYPLEELEGAIEDVRNGVLKGGAVIIVD